MNPSGGAAELVAQVGPLRPLPASDSAARRQPSDRRRARAGSGRPPRCACGGLDRLAGGALPQPAARSDRGFDLWPRMATGLRQAAAFAVVAGRDRLPRHRPRFRLFTCWRRSPSSPPWPLLCNEPAAGRPDRRFGRCPDRRWTALPQLHRRQVQSRRHTAAVLGPGRLCPAPGAARRLDRALGAARAGDRDFAVGEVFRRHAGGSNSDCSS